MCIKITNLWSNNYQTIYTTWFGSHTQREWLAFWPEFIITDDAGNNRTTITIDPAYLGGWGWGWVADGNDFVVSGAYAPLTNTLTLTRNGWGVITIPFTWMTSTDELVKIWTTWTARYLNTIDFEDNGVSIDVKKQMSIVSDASWLKLENDETSPDIGDAYKVWPGWQKWRYPDAWSSQIVLNETLKNTVTHAHNLNKYPTVLCIDHNNDKIIPGNINYTDLNNIEVTFMPAFTGSVVIS